MSDSFLISFGGNLKLVGFEHLDLKTVRMRTGAP
jgi:hypothetical protein